MKESVTIIGTLNAELFLSGINRLPEWGKQIHARSYRRVAAGSGPRVAFPLATFGVTSYLIGCVGRDEYGLEILDALKEHGCSTEGIRVIDSADTGLCVILTREDGERAFTAYLGSVAETSEEIILDHFDLVEETEYLLITGYFNLPGIGYDGWKRIIEKARKKGKQLILDTGWDPGNWQEKTKTQILDLLTRVDTFIPNRDEAKALSGREDPVEMAEFFTRAGVSEVVLKLDREGSAASSGGQGYVHANALDVEVFDTTAAGEAFNAGYLFGLLQNWDMKKRLACGNALAGLFISNSSGTYPTPKMVKQHMEVIEHA